MLFFALWGLLILIEITCEFNQENSQFELVVVLRIAGSHLLLLSFQVVDILLRKSASILLLNARHVEGLVVKKTNNFFLWKKQLDDSFSLVLRQVLLAFLDFWLWGRNAYFLGSNTNTGLVFVYFLLQLLFVCFSFGQNFIDSLLKQNL